MNIKPGKLRKEPEYFSRQVVGARRFYRGLQPGISPDIWVVAGGRETCMPNYTINRESFRFNALEFVVQGEGELVCSGKQYALTAGTVFTYGPGIAHSIRAGGEKDLVKYFVNFAGAKARDMFGKDLSLAGVVQLTSAPADIADLFDRLIDYGIAHSALGDRICSVLGELLLLKIAETALPYGKAASAAFDTYRRVSDYINKNYLALWTLDQVAQSCHINEAYLCRLFKRFAHQSPYQYLLRLKMNHAAVSLSEHGKLVKQVADEIGYDDEFHFSRAFKKVFGMPPMQFAQHHWK
jgi:AraC-like DNA-binding protein